MSANHDAADRVQDAIDALHAAVKEARYGEITEALAHIADAENHLGAATSRLVVIFREQKT